jgi:methionyl-tRNA formyltransferase
MRIGYFADGPWSHRALELITQNQDHKVIFIVPRYENQDPVLRCWAEKIGASFMPCRDVNSKEFIETLKRYPADIFVSMSFDQILKKEIIQIPKKGFINCHAGALPFYRGRNPLNWVLINGENKFGITVHYVDEGIDTGDIVVQKLFPISGSDNYSTLLELAIKECANILYLALDMISRDTVDAINQSTIHPVGTYFGRRLIGDEKVNFEWGAKRIHNFVRGIVDPGPCARFYFEESEYAILDSELFENSVSYISTVGEVVGLSNGVVVKCGDSTIGIKRVSKIIDGNLSDIITPRFKIGSRLK